MVTSKVFVGSYGKFVHGQASDFCNMYIFLKFGDIEKVISNITVDDDCLPVVDGENPVSQGGQHGVSVEAVQWFKSLAMEAVYIDCGSRDVRWCPKKMADQMATTIPNPSMEEVVMRRKQGGKGSTPQKPTLPMRPFMPKSARPLFAIHPHVLDFDPNVDEMFERTENILTRMSSGKLSNEEVRREVAQLLHCNIFPAVCFIKEDAPVLEGCLRRIGLKIRTVEKDMMTKERTVTITESSLNKQKDRIIANEEMSRDSYVRSCNRAFLDAFYVHVTKDIQTLNVSLELIQGKVNSLKKKGRESELKEVQKNKGEGTELEELQKEKVEGTGSGDLQKEGEGTGAQKEGEGTDAQKEGEGMGAQKEGEGTGVQKEGEGTGAQKEGEGTGAQKEGEETDAQKEGEGMGAQKEGEGTGVQKEGEGTGAQKEGEETETEELQILKEERDKIHERLDLLMQIREAIRNVLYRPHVPQKKQRRRLRRRAQEEENCLHNIFLEVHERLKDLKEELKKLCYRKLHFSSMREAIESTLKVIRQDSGELQGDFSEFSVHISTEEESRSAWQSMQVQLQAWMEDRNSSLYTLHMEGCNLIQDLSRSMLSEAELAFLGLKQSDVSGMSLLEEEAEGGQKKTGSDTRSAEFEGRFSSAGDLVREDVRGEMVETIKEQVLKHTWDMARKIVCKMGIDPKCSRHVNRAWLCYMPHFCHESLEAVQKVYFHYHAKKAAQLHKKVSTLALSDIMDDRFFADLFVNSLVRDSGNQGSGEDANGKTLDFPRSHSMDSLAAISLDLQRCSVTDLYAIANKDGARLQQRLELDSVERFSTSDSPNQMMEEGTESENHEDLHGCSTSRNSPQDHHGSGQGDQDNHTIKPDKSSVSSSSDSGASVHSDDLFETERGSVESQGHPSIRSSQTVSSVVGLFESIVQPFHELVQKVIDSPDFFEKLKAVWHTIQFLSEKVTLHCGSSGMDSLLPMSIFAIVSLKNELFIGYYIQLLMLIDFKPDFCVHSMYDFSLMNAYSPYMFLFERQVRDTVVSNETDV